MKNFAYALLVALLTIFIAEIVLSKIYNLPDPYINDRFRTKSTGDVIRVQNPRNKDLTFIFKPTDIYPKNEPKTIPIHLNNYGFRHKDDIKEPKKEYRIFAIGGSTTQNYDYTYDKTWTQVVEKRLESQYNKPIKVYNGGTAGAAMVDHIALLQNRALHLTPDFVILFAGINDLNLLLGDNNIYRFTDIYENIQYIKWSKLFLSKFTLYRMYLNAKTNFSLKSVSSPNLSISKNKQSNQNEVVFIDHNKLVEDTNKLPKKDSMVVNHDYYKHMVRSFIGACKANNVPIVVITQPTTWLTKDENLKKYHWMHKNKEYQFSKDFMQKNMDIMNNNVQTICQDLNVECIRAEHSLPNNSQYFFDDCHFTPNGSIALGNLVADKIINNRFISN